MSTIYDQDEQVIYDLMEDFLNQNPNKELQLVYELANEMYGWDAMDWEMYWDNKHHE